jgi:hypothetical protein
MTDYSTFKVLIDDPAERPGLGFSWYAEAFAEIIRHSKAQFAIGIFGDWGSGKTTLMRAIEHELSAHDDVVTVWFNAWRYEREPHLMVPLLDTLRESLVCRAESAATSPNDAGLANRAAAAIGRVGKALLAGLTLSGGVAGVGIQLDAGKVIDGLAGDPPAPKESLSFYHAGFNMLRDAISEFADQGARRVVVFVDDLDRCLPENALEVLESMKLFFDIEGFVFVAGLDQSVVDRAVAFKYRRTGDPAAAPIEGTAYIKKIFQLPFGLPRIGTEQLQDYLLTLVDGADVPAEQRTDFEQNVRRHLEYLPGADQVNPREVKRLINAYTLQLKILSKRTAALTPDVVLALQLLSFRPDWADLYEHLVADPALFQKSVREARDPADRHDTVWLGARVTMPASFLRYIDSDARELLHTPNIQMYVSTAESTRSTDRSLLDAQSIIGRIRRTLDELGEGNVTSAEAASSLDRDMTRLLELTSRRSTMSDLDVMPLASQIEKITDDLGAGATPSEVAAAAEWAKRTISLLDVIDARLREMRRQTNVGASGA